MEAYYEAQGDSFNVKDTLKYCGFFWNPKDKKWRRSTERFDIQGNSAEESVKTARSMIKAAGIDCDIVYFAGGFKPK